MPENRTLSPSIKRQPDNRPLPKAEADELANKFGEYPDVIVIAFLLNGPPR